ncbi:MAG: DUF3160 domain-containing protein [Patescibacteria group bacterium]|jgi:hypothetical protein|nr:DUF3160 domain-containing protein [Patescibacteria group bacterium]
MFEEKFDESLHQITPDALNNKKRFSWRVLGIIFFVAIILGVGGYGLFKYLNFYLNKTENLVDENLNKEQPRNLIENILKPATVLASRFADYEEPTVEINPQIPFYSVAQNLDNVINKDRFKFSDAAQNLLVKNGFVVIPQNYQEFFSIYELNRMRQIPNFITTDSILHNYHLAFDYLLRDLEKQQLFQEVTNLTYEMRKASETQYEQLKDTEWENAAKRNVAFFIVANKLLYPEAVIPDYVKTEVETELNLIEEHQEIQLSPVINIGKDLVQDAWFTTPQGILPVEALKEDYSQYNVRGHYTRDENLKKYFKAMMYLGRMTFRLKSLDETKSAILMSIALEENNNLQKSWDRVYEPTVFFVGKSDDITFYDYDDILKSVYNTENLNLSLITSDQDKLDAFLQQTKNLESPQINSMPIFAAGIQEDRDQEIKGFRFMGQRFTIDASIFQRLIYREVGDKTQVCSNYDPKQTGCRAGARCLPKGLDIPAAMGSVEALNILEQEDETDYTCYSENMNKMKQYVASFNDNTWTQNLYWGWLNMLRPLLEIKGNGWPVFMQNTAWVHKELTTYLSSWTELKRDTILYAKQVYAELGGGGDNEKLDDRGYVEPNPYVYARLAGLLKMTREGLQIRSLLSEENTEFLDKMEILVLQLKEISEKELNGVALSDEDYNLIRAYGGSLEHFWIQAVKDMGIENKSQLSEEPAAVVADVATDPNGSVLEEATGYIGEIYAIVPIDGELRITKGGVYTHYEFPWPLSDRLTDEKWREMLKNGEEPAMADWTASFVAPQE